MAGAALPLDPYVGQDFYVPAYEVFVRGRKLREETYDILSVTYTDSLTNLDSVDLQVNNWDPDKRTFKYSDERTFMPWSPVEVRMGYFQRGNDQRRPMLTGEITTMTPNFPASGAPSLNIRALNLLHRFRLKQETQSFLNKTDTDIAVQLVKKIDDQLRAQFPNLRIKIDPDDVDRNKPNEQPVEFLAMYNQFPIVFLMERARRIGYELRIKKRPDDARGTEGEVILGFGPTSSVSRPTYVLEWGVSLISVQPALRVAEQVGQVTVRGWSPGGKEPINETAKREDLRGEGVVSPRDLDLAEPALAQEISVDRPVASKDEAKRLAKKMLRQIASELVTAKGKTIGLPDLRAGTKLQLLGLGRRFSGPDGQPFLYVVTDTTHSFSDGGYTTDFTARMEAGEGA